MKLPIRDGGTFDNWFGGHKGVGPPEEHIDQQQKENGGVEYGERRGANLEKNTISEIFSTME